MAAIYDMSAPKESANLRINSSLLAQARSLDINLSTTLEQALAEVVRQRQRQPQRELWLAENQDAIAAYANFVAMHVGTMPHAVRLNPVWPTRLLRCLRQAGLWFRRCNGPGFGTLVALG